MHPSLQGVANAADAIPTNPTLETIIIKISFRDNQAVLGLGEPRGKRGRGSSFRSLPVKFPSSADEGEFRELLGWVSVNNKASAEVCFLGY
ncbi:hypothetical protein NIES39_O04270 [Arthrospira platensis NIES-39]|nr:hypothetical protein NIES39_O04270 [Arthrospira platensis NIES-39]